MFHALLLHRPLLSNVNLHDKVPKAERDIPDVPPRFEPLVPKPGVIPFNSRFDKPMVRGREEAATELMKIAKGKKPKIDPHANASRVAALIYTAGPG